MSDANWLFLNAPLNQNLNLSVTATTKKGNLAIITWVLLWSDIILGMKLSKL